MAEKRKPLNKMVEVLSMRLGMDSADVHKVIEVDLLKKIPSLRRARNG